MIICLDDSFVHHKLFLLILPLDSRFRPIFPRESHSGREQDGEGNHRRADDGRRRHDLVKKRVGVQSDESNISGVEDASRDPRRSDFVLLHLLTSEDGRGSVDRQALLY